MHIKAVIDALAADDPYLQPLLTNCIGASIDSGAFRIDMPDIPAIRSYWLRHGGHLAAELSSRFRLALEVRFSPLPPALLPFPAQNSKHGNYLVFIFPGTGSFSYCLVRKNRFVDAVRNGTPLAADVAVTEPGDLTHPRLFQFLIRFFPKTIPMLRESWTYLHTILPFTDAESLFMEQKLVDNVFRSIETDEGIADVRRFVGLPCFTPVNYMPILAERCSVRFTEAPP